MRKVLILFYFLVQCALLSAQSVGIGTSTPNSSAMLDVTSSSKGFLPPLLTQAQRTAIVNPAEGLLVYDTTTQRFYQYQNGVWRFLLNSEYWATSSTRNFLYNLDDSLGIGTTLPDQKLDVRGDIHADNVVANDGMIITNGASGATVFSTGNISAGGSLIAAQGINVGNELAIDNASATLQFRTGGVNKTYFQLSGDNMRIGTNSGNSSGEFIVRMNGDNVVKIDGKSNLSLLKGLFASNDHGKLVIGNKLIRTLTYGANSLPVLYGRVFSDGSSASMWPPTGTSDRISTGVYEIETNLSNASAHGVIVVTTAGASLPRICVGRYLGNGKFRVEIFNLAGNHINNDFFFMINDPMN